MPSPRRAARLFVRPLGGALVLAPLVLTPFVLAPRLASAQQPGQPQGAPPQGGGDKAAGAQPAIPPPGTGVQPIPPPTEQVKPTPPPPLEARPPSDVPVAPAPPSPALPRDQVRDPGYLPGYKTFPQLSLSPYSPRVGATPGGVTPGFGAPMPPGEWTFKWSGYLSATMQASINQRQTPSDGQSRTVIHVPPQVLDDYQSFVGTATMPGQWIAMNFRYGNRDVTANVTLSTWNPSQPITFYQPGSQNFIQNAFLSYNVPDFGRLRLNGKFGYFYVNYGNLGEYDGPGLYQAPIVGGPRGIGGLLTGEVELSPRFKLWIEEGFLGNRSGRPPAGNTPATPNTNVDPLQPASFVQHAHAGLIYRSQFVLRISGHWLYNFARDNQVQTNCFIIDGEYACRPNVDNMTTRGVDERTAGYGNINVVGADAVLSHPIWGLLGLGVARIKGSNAYALDGLLTFAGVDGQQLAERWLGLDTGGTGTVDVAGFNYTASLGRILNAPGLYDANAPDLRIVAGAQIATSRSDNPYFDDRLRHKWGVDAVYSLLPFLAAGLRFDRVVPNSHDPLETFHVIKARLMFKTDWSSRETVSLIYAKWFLGAHSHPEYSVLRAPWLDDQLIALNVNMWW